MSISLKDAGVWKDGTPWVKDGGVWKPADKIWAKDAGVWKEIYSARLPPFSLDGTFDDGGAFTFEGWTGTGTSGGNPNARTSPGCVQLSASQYIEYVVPKETCAGLTITASIWHKAYIAVSTNRNLSYKIGSGSFVTLANVTNTSTTYAKMSGSFDNPGDDDVTIRVECGSGAYYTYADDWSISGE